jgi:hypothetical protein
MKSGLSNLEGRGGEIPNSQIYLKNTALGGSGEEKEREREVSLLCKERYT